MFHEFRLRRTATTDMAVLPGVLGCSFDRLRTGSPCDVPFRYGNQSRGTAGRVARWHAHPLRARCAPLSPASGFPVSSRSLRSAQSRKRVPSFVVSLQQLKFPAVRPVGETCGRDLSTSSSRVAAENLRNVRYLYYFIVVRSLSQSALGGLGGMRSL
jgi:hypothetical protein